MAQVVCQWCKLKDDKEKQIKDTKGFYHTDKCHTEYISDKEFKRIEREKQTQLAIKIAEIHGLDSYQLIPRQFYPYLEDIRNGTELFGKLGIKNYKNGLRYEAIAYTYEYCKDKIEWARQSKEFKDKLSELKYCLAIVRNNLADAKEHAANMKRREETVSKASIQTIDDYSHHTTAEPVYVKKKDELDISDML